MLIKTLARKRASFKQLVNYLGDGADERSMVLLHNLRGDGPDEWVREFQENEALRMDHRKGHTVLHHDILSFRPESTPFLNEEKLRDITREYIRLRAERGLVLAMSHQKEGKHTHVHLMISGVEIHTGKSLRLSKSEFARAKAEAQRYMLERYPELGRSAVRHGHKVREERSRSEDAARRRSHKPSRNDALRTELRSIFDKARTLDAFWSALKAKGYEPYLRGGKSSGLVIGERHYRFRTLGIEPSEMEKLDRAASRKHDLSRMRERVTREHDHSKERSRALERARDGEKGEETSEHI